MNNLKKSYLLEELNYLLLENSIKEQNVKNCSITNCLDCFFNYDFFYLNGKCVKRNRENSKWLQIEILNPVYSGINKEIQNISLLGFNKENLNGKIIAILQEDLSKTHSKIIKYKDKDIKYDDYALSCIIELIVNLKED